MRRIVFLVSLLFTLCFLPRTTEAQIPWHEHYEIGLNALEMGEYETAVHHLTEALKTKKKDKAKTRKMGTIFISYYGHRELGIGYYYLGQFDLAKAELNLSLAQAPTYRAREYLEKIEKGILPPTAIPAKITSGRDVSEDPEPLPDTKVAAEDPEPLPDTKPGSGTPAEIGSPMTEVGERLRIAILPFENRGSDESMDLLDKLITVFVNLERFKVLERARLEKVLEEHQLGMSGFIDATTAAEIGKGIGVDAVVTGSISWNRNEVGVDARFIDTETAAIISAQDAYSTHTDLRSLNDMLGQLAGKFRGDLPVVTGYVIDVSDGRITFDLGRSKHVKKGMKCYVYREGAPIIHPVSKQVIGKMIDILCESQLDDVYEGYSIGTFIERKGIPAVGDMVITK